MSAKNFICSDDIEIEISQCLKHRGCRLKNRCASLRYLQSAGHTRKWRGVTASMAGTGARHIWLNEVAEFSINPKSRVFAILGTGLHSQLHDFASDVGNILSEEPLSGGTPDCLEQDEYADNKYVLIDDKTWGAFKVRKALGLVKDSPVLDKGGEPVLLKSGKNKGKPKMGWSEHPEEIDLFPADMQLNRYRLMFEDAGFSISKIKIEVPVRDGGIMQSASNGVTKNLYFIDVPFLSDQEVSDYYNKKEKDVDAAFRDKYAPKCSDIETWNGRRCDGYCDVKKQCEKMG